MKKGSLKCLHMMWFQLYIFLEKVKLQRQDCFPGGASSSAKAGDIETQIWSLGWEDPLEKEMATHSSILAWRIPGKTEKPGRLQSIGSQRIGQDGSDLALLETRWSVVAIGLGDGRETWICKVQWSYRAVKLSRLL